VEKKRKSGGKRIETSREARISGREFVVREIAADQMGAACFKATDEYDGDPPYVSLLLLAALDIDRIEDLWRPIWQTSQSFI